MVKGFVVRPGLDLCCKSGTMGEPGDVHHVYLNRFPEIGRFVVRKM